MRRLLILRHAKAGPHDDKHDKERELTDRGRSDSALMGRLMREKAYLPDLVLCSTATRTRETWEHAGPELGVKPQTNFLDVLYDASAGTILNCLQRAGNLSVSLLYIGHNPGLELLARMLVRDPENSDARKLAATLMFTYPTGALTVIDFEIRSWSEITPSEGILVDFVAPSDLKSK
ncbi:MAG TPA: histidine phosphatase family protein [Rhizomicrobium sp.]|jgi:phosphohistidine phosphatase|nr:histidine phosphatase family protein [Rhizomicrobium sp.]